MHDIKYYFCVDPDGRKGIPTFIITPKEHFDNVGFLLDTSSFDPKVPCFQRVADSTFEYHGNADPEGILLMQGDFMWRDMLTEIKYTYKRRRALNL